jgi:hypothetical protein
MEGRHVVYPAGHAAAELKAEAALLLYTVHGGEVRVPASVIM